MLLEDLLNSVVHTRYLRILEAVLSTSLSMYLLPVLMSDTACRRL